MENKNDGLTRKEAKIILSVMTGWLIINLINLMFNIYNLIK